MTESRTDVFNISLDSRYYEGRRPPEVSCTCQPSSSATAAAVRHEINCKHWRYAGHLNLNSQLSLSRYQSRGLHGGRGVVGEGRLSTSRHPCQLVTAYWSNPRPGPPANCTALHSLLRSPAHFNFMFQKVSFHSADMHFSSKSDFSTLQV